MSKNDHNKEQNFLLYIKRSTKSKIRSNAIYTNYFTTILQTTNKQILTSSNLGPPLVRAI